MGIIYLSGQIHKSRLFDRHLIVQDGKHDIALKSLY